MLLKGVLERWPDLAEAKEAEKLLLEYDAKPEKPWEADDLAEQRRYLIAGAPGPRCLCQQQPAQGIRQAETEHAQGSPADVEESP